MRREDGNRWRCPSCGKTEQVQVCYPAWFRETLDFEIRHLDNDFEADVRAWYCEACNDFGSGEPCLNDNDDLMQALMAHDKLSENDVAKHYIQEWFRR